MHLTESESNTYSNILTIAFYSPSLDEIISPQAYSIGWTGRTVTLIKASSWLSQERYHDCDLPEEVQTILLHSSLECSRVVTSILHYVSVISSIRVLLGSHVDV
jgi:hypothetical protein